MDREDRLLNLLVVEDNSGDLLLIEDFLFEKISNPSIEEARTFKEAKHLLEAGKKYDAILLDLSLPDKGGEELLDEIVKVSNSIPVIVLTGYADIAFGIKSLSLGIADYLLKDELTATSLHKSILYSIERKEVASHLKESEKRYRDLFHLSPQPMWLYDMETWRFVDVNQAAVKHYGYSKKEFLSMTVLEISPPEDVEKVKEEIIKLRDVLPPFSQEVFRHRKKDGEIIKVEIKSNVIEFEGRKAEIVLAHDITERINYIRDIVDKNKRLQEIAWIQSHVVRAPLARLMGLVNAISDSVDDEKDYQKLYRLIMKSANELDGIIRDIAQKADKINVTEEAGEES
jgi:PAS domain S-box-containing protein